jgi:hypothetical protein
LHPKHLQDPAFGFKRRVLYSSHNVLAKTQSRVHRFVGQLSLGEFGLKFVAPFSQRIKSRIDLVHLFL